jgi:phosphopantothenoylcysteine decarboxylase
MAKIVNGLCDNLLTSVVRAWDVTGSIDGVKKKIIVSPAMNTAMWNHPVTKTQMRVLEEEWGGENGWFEVLRPVSKNLACGDVGSGAMVLWEQIVEEIDKKINN